MSPLMQPQSVEPRQFHIRQAVAEGDGTGQGRRTLMAETQTEATAKPLARRGKTAAKNSRAPATVSQPKKMGRPSGYSQEVADRICEHIAEGGFATDLHRFGLPGTSTLSRWMNEREDFRDAYARARERRAETFAQQIVEIADTEEDPQKARNRIEARKWLAMKLLPRVYGDKQEVTINHDVGSTAAEVLMRLTEQAKQAKLQAPDIIDITPTKD